MANSIIGKVNRGLKVLYRKASYFKFEERKMLCSTLLQAHFDYGYNVWYRGLTKSLRIKLQTSQNKMIRYILDSGSRFHVGYDSFSKLNWLSFQKRMEYLTLSTMFSVFNNCAPMYMISQFSRMSNHHQHQTRSVSNSFALPRVNSHGHHSFRFNGIKMWNNLSNDIQSCNTKDMFKRKCKKYLMEELRKEETDVFVY